jgi:hypothetical protein
MRATDFYRLYKFISSTGFEPANLETKGKHAKHYTIEATSPGHTNNATAQCAIRPFLAIHDDREFLNISAPHVCETSGS